MQDMDSAVGRLDSLLMSIYYIVAILIIAVSLEAQLVTLVTGAGTLVLGNVVTATCELITQPLL